MKILSVDLSKIFKRKTEKDEHEDIASMNYKKDEVVAMINDGSLSVREVSEITGIKHDWLIAIIHGRIKKPNQERLNTIAKFLIEFSEFKAGWKL